MPTSVNSCSGRGASVNLNDGSNPSNSGLVKLWKTLGLPYTKELVTGEVAG